MKKLLFAFLFICTGFATQAESISEKAKEEIAVFGCDEDCAQYALLMGDMYYFDIDDQYLTYQNCSDTYC